VTAQAELHLPDLPEVTVALGPLRSPPAPAGARLAFGLRVRNTVSAYLPMLLMALLALGTWWLVKNTPTAPPPVAETALRSDPDYQMKGFAITRYGADGRVSLRLEGDLMRHYPDTDRVEIDAVRIHALGKDGRVLDAVARRALTNGDTSEVQLLGGAQVRALGTAGEVLEIESEFLHAFLDLERVRTHLPVLVRQGRSEARASGLEYDHLSRQLQLQGPVRTVFQPGVAGAGRKASK